MVSDAVEYSLECRLDSVLRICVYCKAWLAVLQLELLV